DCVAGLPSRRGFVVLLRCAPGSRSREIDFLPGVNASRDQVVNRTEMPVGDFLPDDPLGFRVVDLYAHGKFPFIWRSLSSVKYVQAPVTSFCSQRSPIS